MNELTTTQSPPSTIKPIRLKPKQKLTIKYWVSEGSETFGNLYQSALKAGFKRSYALNLTHLRPNWLSETLENAQFEPEHIRQGIQNIAQSAPNSKSPDDTRLKAYELLGKITGIIDNKAGVTNINIVQPILGGSSVQPNPPPKQRDIIEVEIVDNESSEATEELDKRLDTLTDAK